MQTLNERLATSIKGGGKKTDVATKIRLDDLDRPFQREARAVPSRGSASGIP